MWKKVSGLEPGGDFVLMCPLFSYLLFTMFCHCRVWREWRSFLRHNADLGEDRGKQCLFLCEVSLCNCWPDEEHQLACSHVFPTEMGKNQSERATHCFDEF